VSREQTCMLWGCAICVIPGGGMHRYPSTLVLLWYSVIFVGHKIQLEVE